MTVVDVGANIGVHTLHLSRLVGLEGRVIAFEPNPLVREELRRNLDLNNSANVQILPVALWDAEGEETLYFPTKGMEAMGSLRDTSRFKTAHKSRVDTTTLDSVLWQLRIHEVDFVKMDVEGAELHVVRGMKGLLCSEKKPSIVYESCLTNSVSYGYTPEDLSSFLMRDSYVIHKLDSENYLALP